MGKHQRGERIESRIPNVGPPFTTQQVDDAVLEEQLRLDEASREEPPPVERVIDREPNLSETENPARDTRP